MILGFVVVSVKKTDTLRLAGWLAGWLAGRTVSMGKTKGFLSVCCLGRACRQGGRQAKMRNLRKRRTDVAVAYRGSK